MDINSDSLMDVEIVGFKPQERVLIASMFKVSEMRNRVYREWQPDQKNRPDCVLLDIEDKEARMRLELLSVRKKYGPIITIGPMPDETPAVDAHIQRPIRWAGILHTLDTVLGDFKESPADLSEEQAVKLSESVNKLEIAEVEPWYDRDQEAKEFTTDAAILVVDPDPVIFKFISKKLTNSGYRVDHALTVGQAGDMVKERRYNCIVVEMDLPDEDGIKFCKLIKQSPDRRRKTAVVILTTNRTIMDRMRGSMAGCDAFLNKPVAPEYLLVTVEKFLPKWKMKA